MLTVLVCEVSVSVFYSGDEEGLMGKGVLPYCVAKQRAGVCLERDVILLAEVVSPSLKRWEVFVLIWTADGRSGLDDYSPGVMAGMGRSWPPWEVLG